MMLTDGISRDRDLSVAGIAVDRVLIAEALAQLSDEHLAVLRRSYYERWTTAQIADDLQITEGAVKTRLHYAARALLSTLQGVQGAGTQNS